MNARIWSRALFCITAFGTNATAQEFEARLQAYRDAMNRPALLKRIQARDQLAATGDPRAHDWLRKDYSKPEAPEEFVRSLVVTIAAKQLGDVGHAEAWQAWRDKHDDDEDAWLWFHALRVAERAKPGSWREVATSRKSPLLRAIALEVGREYAATPLPGGDDLTTLVEIMDSRRAFRSEREWLVEAVASWFARAGVSPSELSDDHKELLRRIVDFAGERRRTFRSQLTISRTMARVLACDDLGPAPEAWAALLADTSDEERAIRYAQERARLTHTFFGIPEHGRRICYLIDASDSMRG